MSRLFGTDGVRGIANYELTPELCMNIGKATALLLGSGAKVLVGCDTRASADMIQSAIIAGLCSAGADVLSVGTVPTPAVAYLVKEYQATAGIMISASHNLYEYNGIKIFGATGHKLTDEQEDEIEALIRNGAVNDTKPVHSAIGKVIALPDAVEEYISHICSTTDSNFSGVRVLIDCANGSASVTAKAIFEGLGAECKFIFDQPNGVNINDKCGSTNLTYLKQAVVEGNYDLGIAFDGDADRMLAVDETGNVVNGDQILAIIGEEMQKNGKLKDDCIVVTVMSNLGFFEFAKAHNLKTCTTNVGDRYVLEQMLANGYNLGGEQSGHIIFTDYMTTGDGQLSAVQLIAILKKSEKKLSELANKMRIFPQVLKNVYADADTKEAFQKDKTFSAEIAKLEERLHGKGRIFIRPSGTEPLIRIMIEGEKVEEIEALADEIVQKMKERF